MIEDPLVVEKASAGSFDADGLTLAFSDAGESIDGENLLWLPAADATSGATIRRAHVSEVRRIVGQHVEIDDSQILQDTDVRASQENKALCVLNGGSNTINWSELRFVETGIEARTETRGTVLLAINGHEGAANGGEDMLLQGDDPELDSSSIALLCADGSDVSLRWSRIEGANTCVKVDDGRLLARNTTWNVVDRGLLGIGAAANVNLGDQIVAGGNHVYPLGIEDCIGEGTGPDCERVPNPPVHVRIHYMNGYRTCYAQGNCWGNCLCPGVFFTGKTNKILATEFLELGCCSPPPPGGGMDLLQGSGGGIQAPSVSVFPNPAVQEVAIHLVLGRSEREIVVSVYDVSGRRIRELRARKAGETNLTWDGKDQRGRPAPAGVYLVRVQIGDEVLPQKVLLLR